MVDMNNGRIETGSDSLFLVFQTAEKIYENGRLPLDIQITTRMANY